MIRPAIWNRSDLRYRQNARRGFVGLHGAKRVVRSDYYGGYTHYVMCADGDVLCPKCVRENWREIVWATRHAGNGGDPCWTVAGLITAGDFDEDVVTCAHCNTELYNPLD